MGAGHQGRRRDGQLSIWPGNTMGYLTDTPIYDAPALPKARAEPVAKSPKATKSAGLDNSPARKTAREKS
jgi:hypothetical protein